MRSPAAVTSSGNPWDAPRLAEAAGLDKPEQLFPGTPGRSLWGLLTTEAEASPREVVYSEAFTGKNAWRMVRDHRHKFVILAEGNDELHDLKADPWELTNVIGQPENREIRQRLERALLGVMSAHGAAVNRVPCPERVGWWREMVRPS